MDHRQALADLLIDVYLLAAEALEASGMLMEALQRLRLAERMDPLREDVNHALVRLYALAGKKHEALRHFHVYQERLKREWDVAPGAEMEALYRDIGVGRIASVALQVPNGRRVVPVFAHDASSRLVGRTRVLDILMQQYAQATTGKGGTVLISGEMGVGKVRLVSELMAYAQSKGAVILRGSAPSLASDDAPYWPIAQALEMYVTDLPDQSRADLAARYRELGWLVPTLAPVGGAAEDVPTSPPETSRLFASVARLLTDLSQHNVLVIALRDVHSADASTVKLLEYLVQLAPERKWLILGSYREEDIPSDSPFPTFLTFAARHGLGLNIELHRLAQQDNNELVRLLLGDGAVSEDLLDFVFEASLGNPFFTYQVVETLVAQGRVSLDSGVWHLDPGTPIPLSREVRELVAMRLSRFDDDVQDLLQLAALTEPAISFNLLFESAQTLGCPLSEAVLLSALDRVIEARILEECDQGYTFSHPMYRAVILDRLSRHRREQLWSALEAVRTSRTRTGHPATAPPTDTIMESVPTAALLPWEAAAKYGREVDALDSQGLVVESAAMRQKLAAALVAMGRYERAVSVLRQASTIYREVQDDEGCARIEAQLDLLNQVSDL
jgi:tetratricopeptide (TPR) repeat protein